MNAPCNGCPYREVGCHSYCGPYKAFQAGREEAIKRRREETAADEAEIAGEKRRTKPIRRTK